MSKRITKSALRAYADQLRTESLLACLKAHKLRGNTHNSLTYEQCGLQEQAAVKRAISNELYALCDGGKDEEE